MALIRFHMFFLITLGFLLGNDITYAKELSLVHQTETSWVQYTHAEHSAAVFAYDEIHFVFNVQGGITTTLWSSYANLQPLRQRHYRIALVHYKKFKRQKFIRRCNCRYTPAYTQIDANEEPLT